MTDDNIPEDPPTDDLPPTGRHHLVLVRPDYQEPDDQEPDDEIPDDEIPDDEIPDEWRDISAEVRRVLLEGEDASRTHRAGLPRIFKMGRALLELQEEAKRRSHSAEPKGRRYIDAWNTLAKPLPV